MSRHAVPAIVFVTLSIMFGSSLLTQRRVAALRQNTSENIQFSRRSDASVPAQPKATGTSHGIESRASGQSATSLDGVPRPM
jgi:hypothetical protein